MTEPSGDLAPYSELADLLGNLPLLLREGRRQRRVSVRVAGQQIGCSPATVHRIEHGDDCALSNAVAVLRWLDGSVPSSPEETPDAQ